MSSAAGLLGNRASALKRHFFDSWFAPSDPRVLAMCRILIFWFVWPGFRISQRAMGYPAFADAAWFPVGMFKLWGIPLFDVPILHGMNVLLSVASLCALLGLCYPVSATVTAALFVYLSGIAQNFGKINHDDHLLLFAVWVMALARAADTWSIDAWIKRRFFGKRAPQPSGEYRWPVQFVALLIVTMYAAAGASKLVQSGWSWAFSDSFRWLLLRHHFSHKPPTQIGVWLAEVPVLCKLFALAALLIEVTGPLAMLQRCFYRVLLPLLALLQFCIWLLMGVPFKPMIPLFLCLLPWRTLLTRWDRLKERAVRSGLTQSR